MKPILFYRIKDMIFKIGASWDQLALDENNASQKAQQYINPEPERQQDNDPYKYTLEYCLAHSGETINNRYRQNRPDDIDIQISDMLSSHTTDKDLILYRGVCDHVYELMLKNASESTDCDLLEKGFMATSLVKNHELNYKRKLRIFVPAKSHVIYMGNVNYEPNFYEVDVQHGAKLKIISIDKTYINCRLMETA